MFYKETNFKETPIGKIPNDWEAVRLGDVCKFKRGFSYRSDQITKEISNIQFTTINDVEKEGGLKRKPEKIYLREEAVDPEFFLNDGDVLIANTDMSKGFIIGAPILINTFGQKAVFSMDLTKLIFDASKIDSEFLFYYLKRETIRRKMKAFAQGTNVFHLNHDLVEKLSIFLPQRLEQQKIAEVLGVVDSAIELVDRVIWKSERLKKGLMQTLLTRGIGHTEFKETRIGRIPKEWDIAKLGEIATIRYGLGQPPESDENGTPMIRATNIKRGVIVETDVLRVKRSTIPESRNPFLREGDVIVVRSGAYTGDIGHITKRWEGAIAGYDLVVSPSNRINSVYLAHYLLSLRVQTYFSQLKSRSAQPHLNSEQVSDTPIALPSLSEQRNIADFLSTIDKKLGLERKEKTRLERVKRGLMDLLLTGKVRVKVN